ncbi:hypothetical protein SS50377_26344 [Spironucleus salmonicida]|uniref:Uncharacterized protein n=1 Tax=Spironucleus salmonicida TaxID=348837 RepID=V6LU64_9EUKA|nr:hypothetical protein SS50377_26344 [Spironucleus salmonicida]|eukprot:EST47788.1 Hypothetical protein SS50377_12188 [Spironucleus salmonicida]
MNPMAKSSQFDISVDDLYTKSSFNTLRSVFQPANNNQQLLDRGMSDWQPCFSVNTPLKIKHSNFEKFDIFSLIWIAQQGLDVFERYQALSQLQKRGWIYQEQFDWINIQQNMALDSSTWQLKKK